VRERPFHPWLLSAYAVLALLAVNLAQVHPLAALRPLVAALAGSSLVWLALQWGWRDGRRAAVGCSLLVALFFSYGHVYNYLERQTSFGRHRLLLPLWLALAAFGLWWTAKRLRDLSTATLALNVIGLAALAFPAAQMALFGLHSLSAPPTPSGLDASLADLHPPAESPPDVYYIILDAYTRGDILQAEFAFDNTPFLDSLSRMGFYVAECSQSNYAQTELSLTSALNMDYLDALGVPIIADSQDRSPLWPLFRSNRVQQLFEQMGYRLVAFDSGFYRTQLDNADVYLSPHTGIIGGVTGFEALLTKTSAALIFTDAATVLPRALSTDVDAAARQTLRQTILYQLETLPSVPQDIGGHKFVFVHILAPHEPFVFGPNGEETSYGNVVDDDTYRVGYREEIEYLNQRLLAVLGEIIANSDTPPIILLQGDHGAGVTSKQGRMSILNAYYLPCGEAGLYATISPVNSFRVVLNACFGGHLPLRQDVSYYSVYDSPYNFYRVPPAQGCQP